MKLPPKDAPTYAAMSGEALQSGIRRVMEFGKTNEEFTEQIETVLDEYGVKYE